MPSNVGSLIKLNASGVAIGTYPLGTNIPESIAIDAFGNIWVANNNGKTVTELNASGFTIAKGKQRKGTEHL